MTTYEGLATIRQGDADIQIECSYTFLPASPPSLGEWRGRFTNASAPVELRVETELILPDAEPV
jgi:hypothetical protein